MLETSKKRTKLILLSILSSFALLTTMISPTTLAQWTHEADYNPGVITSGDLVMGKMGTWTFYNAPNNNNTGITMINDFSNYRIVPGDTIMARQYVDVGLEGDNMMATLAVNVPEITGDLAPALQARYDVTNINNNQQVFLNKPLGNTSVFSHLKTTDVNGEHLNNVADLMVELYITLPETINNQDYASVLNTIQGTLPQGEVILNQIRNETNPGQEFLNQFETTQALVVASQRAIPDETVWADGKATVGENVTFEVTLRNDNDVDMENVTLDGFTPYGVTIKAHETYTFTKTLLVSAADDINGSVTTTTFATGEATMRADGQTALITPSFNITILTSPVPNPSMTLASSGATIDVEDTAVSVHVITNNGNTPNHELTLVPSLGDPITLGSMAPGETRNVQTMASPTENTTITYELKGRPDNESTIRTLATSNATILVNYPIPNATLALSVPTNPISGDDAIIQATVTNTGEIEITNVNVTSNDNQYSCNINTIPVNDTVTCNITIPNATSNFNFTATTTADVQWYPNRMTFGTDTITVNVLPEVFTGLI